MRFSFTTIGILLMGMAAIGCRQAVEPIGTETSVTRESPSSEPPSRQSPNEDLVKLRFKTNDVKKWSDYEFPLELTFNVPEVPPEIVGPFSADDIPAEE